MALVPLVYIGHFIPEQGFVRIQDSRIVTTRLLNTQTITTLLKKYLGDDAGPDQLPADWGMSILPDHIVCVLRSAPEALQFAADYAEQEGATIVNYGSFLLMTPAQLRESAALVAASAAGLETPAGAGG